MDRLWIREAFDTTIEVPEPIKEASGTSATPGPGAIGGGIAPFKARMGTWRRQQQEQVEQSTQHASDAQLINPMHETTHEEVNLFDEERMAFGETPLTPFSGLQINDFEAGILKLFEQVEKIVQYNITNTTDPSNRNYEKIKAKFNILKNKAAAQVEKAIDSIENDEVLSSEVETNISDLVLLMALMNAYGDNEDANPIEYAKKQAERLLQIARDDALDTANEVIKTRTYFNTSNPDDALNNVEYFLPSNLSRLVAATMALNAIKSDRFGEAVFWNKLRKTIETYNWSDDDKERGMAQDNTGEEAIDEPQLATVEPTNEK